MCDPAVQSEIRKAVQVKLDAGEPFTSACISHPIIKDQPSVRHYDCSQEVRSMWRGGQMIDSQGSTYVRTNITVWPDGPGGTPANAWLYHPDQYDPDSFKPRSRVLARGVVADDEDDKGVTITAAADGSPVRRQCEVQSKDNTLNVPRHILKETGWLSGDGLVVDVSGSIVTVKRARAGDKTNQYMDKEGRVRLHGRTVTALQTKQPIAFLVEPKGAWKYVQISNTLPADDADADATATATPATASASTGRGVSVWDE